MAAAVGYAGGVLFLTTAVCIGTAIAVGVLTSKAVGAGETSEAKRFLIHCYLIVWAITLTMSLILFIFTDELLVMIGASGRALELAHIYLRIMVFSVPILGTAMASMAALRSFAEPKLAMNATLVGGLVNAVLDPILIFGLDLNIAGAALASLLSRATVLAMALIPLQLRYRILVKPDMSCFGSDCKKFFVVAFSAILTNIATPLGAAFVTKQVAQFGDQAVSGMAVLSRLIPVAFVVNYASSGAISPIVGQNFGAGNLVRVRAVLVETLKFLFVYTLVVGGLLYLLQSFVVDAFNAKGDSRDLIQLFCGGLAFLYFFDGITFGVNACLNNIGRAPISSIINISKATIGLMPFVLMGAHYGGATGILVGQSIGIVVTGICALGFYLWLLSKVVKDRTNTPDSALFR